MRKSLIRAVAIAPLTLLLAAGCKKEVLTVLNTNSPDVVRVFATAASVEGVVQGLGSQFWAGQSCSECMQTQSKNIALETYGSVANFGMNTRNAIPRSAINNDRGNSVQAGNLSNFSTFSKVTRNATTAIQALDRLIVAAGTGGNALGSLAQDARARSFAFFINGAALGYLAMGYDSAAIVTPKVPSDIVPELSFYPDVAAAGLALMDSAIASPPARTPRAERTGSHYRPRGLPALPLRRQGSCSSSRRTRLVSARALLVRRRSALR